MNTEETLTGNKLIAEFMGYQFEEPTYVFPDGYYTDSEGRMKGELQFDASWDWLMPVVEKIEKDVSRSIFYGFTVVIADKNCMIKCHENGKQDGVIYQTPYGYNSESKIDAVYQAVVSFIQWYNLFNSDQPSNGASPLPPNP